MRLQRYPDGMAEWSISLWGRHPKRSLTWTHHLALSKVRRGVYSSLLNIHWGYLRVGRYELRYTRQKPMWKS